MTIAITTDAKFFCALAAINGAPFVDERDRRSIEARLLRVYHDSDSRTLRTKAEKLLHDRGIHPEDTVVHLPWGA